MQSQIIRFDTFLSLKYSIDPKVCANFMRCVFESGKAADMLKEISLSSQCLVQRFLKGEDDFGEVQEYHGNPLVVGGSSYPAYVAYMTFQEEKKRKIQEPCVDVVLDYYSLVVENKKENVEIEKSKDVSLQEKGGCCVSECHPFVNRDLLLGGSGEDEKITIYENFQGWKKKLVQYLLVNECQPPSFRGFQTVKDKQVKYGCLCTYYLKDGSRINLKNKAIYDNPSDAEDSVAMEVYYCYKNNNDVKYEQNGDKQNISYDDLHNYVLRLQDICHIRGLPKPEYVYAIVEEGIRSPIFRCTVKVGEVVNQGMGVNKRLAARLASKTMITSLGYDGVIPFYKKELEELLKGKGIYPDITYQTQGDFKDLTWGCTIVCQERFVVSKGFGTKKSALEDASRQMYCLVMSGYLEPREVFKKNQAIRDALLFGILNYDEDCVESRENEQINLVSQISVNENMKELIEPSEDTSSYDIGKDNIKEEPMISIGSVEILQGLSPHGMDKDSVFDKSTRLKDEDFEDCVVEDCSSNELSNDSDWDEILFSV